MIQPLYTTLKVNNEIELCEVVDQECKRAIEKALLRERISYYFRWPKTSLFGHSKDACIICINDNAREAAEAVVNQVCDEGGYHVKFLMKHSVNKWL